MERLGDSPILWLPDETLWIIAQNLKSTDLISFLLTCKRFSSLGLVNRSICLESSRHHGLSSGLSIKNISMLLKVVVDPNMLTECNFNNCYWIPANLLKPFLIKCPNLEALFVAETRITINHLMSHILPQCSKVTKLSFTLSRGDWRHAKRHVSEIDESDRSKYKPSTRPGDPRNPHTIQRMFAFYQSCHVLSKLKSLDIILKGSVENFCNLVAGTCRDLEHLTLVRKREGPPSMKQRSGFSMKGMFPSFNRVKSFVFVGDIEEGDCDPHFSFGNELTETWSTTLNVRRAFRPSAGLQHSAVALGYTCRFPYSDSFQKLSRSLDGVNVSHLESFWEPVPIFMRKQLVAPPLKLISCFFIDQEFMQFCRNHPLLEAFRLRAFEDDGFPSSKPSAKTWNAESWGNLSRLRILSIEPILLVAENSEEEQPKRIISSSSLSSILLSCPLIEELELAFFSDSKADSSRVEISSKDLSAIAQCQHLKRLTLGSLNVADGQFLIDILKNCSRLASLRLKDLGSTIGFLLPDGPHILVPCCYTEDLIAALPFAKQLTTFCLFQINVYSLMQLMDSLESCASLIQLSLVTPSGTFPSTWTKDDYSRRLLRFCQRMNRLVALYFISAAPESHCRAARTLLNRVITAKRPAFIADIQPPAENVSSKHQYDSKVLPLIHKQVLVRFNSQVDVLPFGKRSFLL